MSNKKNCLHCAHQLKKIKSNNKPRFYCVNCNVFYTEVEPGILQQDEIYYCLQVGCNGLLERSGYLKDGTYRYRCKECRQGYRLESTGLVATSVKTRKSDPYNKTAEHRHELYVRNIQPKLKERYEKYGDSIKKATSKWELNNIEKRKEYKSKWRKQKIKLTEFIKRLVEFQGEDSLTIEQITTRVDQLIEISPEDYDCISVQVKNKLIQDNYPKDNSLLSLK